MVRALVVSLVLWCMPLPTPGQAEENRMQRLTDSAMLQKFAVRMSCNIAMDAWAVEYRCEDAPAPFTARLEVLASYTAGPFSTPQARYLAERRILCADLATERRGRCVQIREIGYRAGALRGFRSELETQSKTVAELVFFCREAGTPAPELIKATILFARGSTLPEDLMGLLLGHLAKLTRLW